MTALIEMQAGTCKVFLRPRMGTDPSTSLPYTICKASHRAKVERRGSRSYPYLPLVQGHSKIGAKGTDAGRKKEQRPRTENASAAHPDDVLLFIFTHSGEYQSRERSPGRKAVIVSKPTVLLRSHQEVAPPCPRIEVPPPHTQTTRSTGGPRPLDYGHFTVKYNRPVVPTFLS